MMAACLVALLMVGITAHDGTLAATVARTITIEHDDAKTRIRITLDHPVVATVSTRTAPDQVLIESPQSALSITATDFPPDGLVTAYRVDKTMLGKGRLLLDVSRPVSILKAEMQVAEGRPGAELIIELAPEPASGWFGAAGPSTPSKVQASPHGSMRPGRHDTGPPPKSKAGRPIVVIDPGHGGLDPGTIGAGNVLEKDIVLAVAHKLREALLTSERYQVAMTRAADNFVALDTRVDLSETIGADLFVSLHADAVDDKSLAGSIRGATVYILSSSASDEEARHLAERENSADERGSEGGAPRAAAAAEVRGILADLLRREREEFSVRARSAVIDELGRRIVMNTKPARSAAFRVLRQPSTPAVLIELGYMTNSGDQQLMTRTDWQQKVAIGIASAIDRFFRAREVRQ